MQPILLKDNAKNRFSEGKENIFSFLSVRFLFKSSAESTSLLDCFAEMQLILCKDTTKN